MFENNNDKSNVLISVYLLVVSIQVYSVALFGFSLGLVKSCHFLVPVFLIFRLGGKL